MAFRLKKVSGVDLEKYKLAHLLPNVDEEVLEMIATSDQTKKEVINFIIRDTAGHQFNSIRVCRIPEDWRPLEDEKENIEVDIELLEEDDKTQKKALYKKLKKLNKRIEKAKYPHKFSDDVCEAHQTCPLYKTNNTPVGTMCPLEYKLVSDWTEGYLKEFEVEIMRQGVDKSMISQLVICDLILYRAMRAIGSTSLIDVGEKPTEFGIAYEKKSNVYLDIIDTQQKIKIRLLNNLAGTRADKKKFKIEEAKSVGAQAAENEMSKVIKAKESIRNAGMPTLIDVSNGDA